MAGVPSWVLLGRPSRETPHPPRTSRLTSSRFGTSTSDAAGPTGPHADVHAAGRSRPPAQTSQSSQSHSAAERWKRLYWLPGTVFVLGMLSMSLLIWIKHIDERQLRHFAFANAVMDLRMRAASSRLWINEAIAAGENGVERARALSDLREATRLSDLLLNGGEAEDGLFSPPADTPELRGRAERVRQILSEWTAITRERLGNPEAGRKGSALAERSDELCEELQRRGAELERIVETGQASDISQSRRLFYGLLLTWPFIVMACTTALLRRERRRTVMDEALRTAKSEVETRVLDRTMELRRVNGQLSLELGERKRTEAALRESEARLRHLSARLLTAQETERKRISTELHDELGHSLILMKFRSGLIAKELRQNQSAAKEHCETLSGFIDQTIEDVRRLSRDLRPSVLEELGLSTALRCLAENYGRNGHTVSASIGDVDTLLSRDVHVVVYRIIQQALTNAGKHAHAQHVSLDVKTQGGWLSFVVEDDGKGFDASEVAMRDPCEKGLGLATMQERARMLGGVVGIWSEKGRGTRVTLDIPVRNNGEARYDTVPNRPCR
jgi:signal transduction histidine kinase